MDTLDSYLQEAGCPPVELYNTHAILHVSVDVHCWLRAALIAHADVVDEADLTLIVIQIEALKRIELDRLIRRAERRDRKAGWVYCRYRDTFGEGPFACYPRRPESFLPNLLSEVVASNTYMDWNVADETLDGRSEFIGDWSAVDWSEGQRSWLPKEFSSC